MVWPALVTLPRKVGLLIGAHNCVDTIAIAVHCAKSQTHKPARILIVDDGSYDGTRTAVKGMTGVEYLAIDEGEGLRACFAKRRGFAELSKDCQYLVAIDADGDYVPPDYIERLLSAIESDCRAAVAYPRVQQFGEQTALIDRAWDPEWLSRDNYMPSTSLIRADALAQVGGWPIVDVRAHDDWACWRRLQALGWRGVQGNTVYYWRRHKGSCSYRHRGRDAAKDPTLEAGGKWSWSQTVDRRNLVTVACPFSGRLDTLEALATAIAGQTYPRESLAVLLYDNSHDAHFNRELRNVAYQLTGYADVRLVRDDTPCVEGLSNREVADAPVDAAGKRPHAAQIMHRVAGAWNRIGQLASTDLVWCLEDDVIPPEDALERLLSSMAPDVAAVSGAYRSRYTENYVAWDWASLDPLRMTHLPRIKGHVQPIGGCGMGCVLVRRQELTAAPARSAGDGRLACDWYDPNFWAGVAHRHQVDRQHRVLIDWDVLCEHRDE